MKRGLLGKLSLAGVGMCALLSADAKVWRVNNNNGVQADFAQVTAAIASTSVGVGDTLYVEGSASPYTASVLTKRLVVIGTGYFLSGASGNAGMQANPNASNISRLDIDSLASGSVIIGMQGWIRVEGGTDDILVTRCNLQIDGYNVSAGTKASNNIFSKSYFVVSSTPALDNCQFINNILYNFCNLANAGNSNLLVRNNVIVSTTLSVSNAYVSNNIFSSGSLTQTNSTIKYNISTSNNLPAGNNNQVNIPFATLFAGGASTDAQFQLNAGSPAIGAGEPINGVTPDAGIFGTADPYRISGIPPIPTIYALTVPASVPSSSTTMSITVSTRSNN